MQKLLISITIIASIFSTGCSYVDPYIDNAFKPLTESSWVHRIDIQQGNILDQNAIDKLKPGMTKHQVQFAMGTPIINDVFHDDRWDYLYTFDKSGDPVKSEIITLHFENDVLVSLEGDYRPSPDGPKPIPTVSLDVPPKKEDKGLLPEIWDMVTPTFSAPVDE